MRASVSSKKCRHRACNPRNAPFTCFFFHVSCVSCADMRLVFVVELPVVVHSMHKRRDSQATPLHRKPGLPVVYVGGNRHI